MSVQIDNLMDVDGLLLGSGWIDVDLGTLRRATTRGSGAGGIEFYWISGDRMYVANAGEVNAVRMIVPDEQPEPEVIAAPEPVAVVAAPEPVAEVEVEVPEHDPNSMMAALKRARETRSDEADDEADDEE